MPTHPFIRVNVSTQSRNQWLEVTEHVQKAVRQAHIVEGYVIIFVPHTTAGVTINENADPDVRNDVLKKLGSLIPHQETYYQHGEGNSDSHLKASLMGSSVTVLIESGKLQLGRWQGIYFCEFDGPREREMLVKLVELNPKHQS